MVTADEIGAVPLFASLDTAGRERVSRVAADISLVPGEYAADEGGERALLAVLEGRIEAIQLVDGIERVVGERQPGDISGRSDHPRDRLSGRFSGRGELACDADRAP